MSVIHIYGASGSGTSTLGRFISEKAGYFFMDTDDYFWLPTDPPFVQKRDRTERLALMRRDIAAHENVVLSGAMAGWGDELIPLFTLAVRLVTATDERIERLKRRESMRFGARIEEGGDMRAAHLAFLQWAASYDTGGPDMRSKAEHDAWEALLPCKRLTLNGSDSPEDNLRRILDKL